MPKKNPKKKVNKKKRGTKVKSHGRRRRQRNCSQEIWASPGFRVPFTCEMCFEDVWDEEGVCHCGFRREDDLPPDDDENEDANKKQS